MENAKELYFESEYDPTIGSHFFPHGLDCAQEIEVHGRVGNFRHSNKTLEWKRNNRNYGYQWHQFKLKAMKLISRLWIIRVTNWLFLILIYL